MAINDIFSQARGLKGLPVHQRNRIIFGVAAGVFLLIIVGGFIANIMNRPGLPGGVDPITLTIWDPLDNEEAYGDIIVAYRAQNPHVTIEYRNVRIEESGQDPAKTYRDRITEALASGEGPDIYLIENTWLRMEKSRLTPLSPPVSESIYVAPDTTGLNIAEIIGEYPDIVRFDFTREEGGDTRIYALPLFIDTLALYYNTDYFNSHNILNSPGTWEKFVDYARRITVRSDGGEIQLSGAALGAADTHGVIRGGDNISNAVDILTLLMLQAGAVMNDQFGRVAFDDPVKRDGQNHYPARDAFTFYTSFADPSSENYTWDPDGFFNVDAFSNGTAAMMLNYSNHIATIKDKNPNLNFKIGLAPQPADRFDKVNYGSYWGLAVARVSENPETAWDFVRFAAQEENVKNYLLKTNKPPALKSLIDDLQNNPEMRVFANQILTARSWAQTNPFEVENILIEAIHEVLEGSTASTLTTIVNNAQNKINSLGIGL
ncbi:MAG: extracellular solute-binding protein [Candidatus Spechtbacterales bacterium]